MKRFIAIFAFCLMSTICRAQYVPGYVPNDSMWLDRLENIKLNNIRFNEKILKENPEAWESYMAYKEIDQELRKKRKTCEIITYAGLGVECASLIPIAIACGNYDGNNPRHEGTLYASMGLCVAGATCAIGGLVAYCCYNQKVKDNKKDFIFQLKTTHDGLGIVTLF